MANIYDISQRYNNIQDLVGNPEISEDLITSALNEIEDEFGNKVEAYCKIIKNYEAEAASYEAEEKRLYERKKTAKNAAAFMKARVEDAMRLSNQHKVKGSLFTLSIQKNPPSVDVWDEKAIPETFHIPQPDLIDKKGLLAELKAGKEIPGATIKQGESLRIR